MGSGSDGSERPALGRRLLSATVIVVVLLVVPSVLGAAVGGQGAAVAATIGAMFGLLLSLRAGWKAAQPLALVLAVSGAMAQLASGTWWGVALLAVTGLAAGLGSTRGLLAPVALIGAASSVIAGTPSVASTLLLATVVYVAAFYSLSVARIAGVPAKVAGVSSPGVPPVILGVGLAAVCGLAAAVALQSGLEHAYWIPMTVFLLVAPSAGVRWSEAARQRVYGTAAGAAAGIGLLSLIDGAAARLVAAAVMLLLVLLVPRPLALNAGLSTLLVTIALSPTGNGAETGGVRLLAVVLAVALVGVGAWVVSRLAPTVPAEERELIGEAVESQASVD